MRRLAWHLQAHADEPRTFFLTPLFDETEGQWQ